TGALRDGGSGMVRRRSTAALAVLAALLLPAALAWPGGRNQNRGNQPIVSPGDPLPGLAADDQAAFADGLAQFSKVEPFDDGLGPVFNGRSCAECHSFP